MNKQSYTTQMLLDKGAYDNLNRLLLIGDSVKLVFLWGQGVPQSSKEVSR